MQRMGLTSAELRAYHRAHLEPVVLRRFGFSVHGINGNVLDHLSPDSVDGQIVVDRFTAPSRVLDLVLFDPDGATDFDPQSPAATGLHYARQIRVEVETFVPDLGDWVGCVPFYGPVRAFDRDGDTVRIVAHGRDALGTGQLRIPLSRKKGTLKTTAMREILGRCFGDDRLAIPASTSRLPATLNLGREAQPWSEARRLAESMNRQLFCTGPGVPTMRPWPARSTFAFDDYLTSKVRATRSLDGVINAVEVWGAKPKGDRTRVHASAVLRQAPGQSMSAAALAPDPGRVWLMRTVENPHLRSHREAQAVADRVLRNANRQLVNIEFDSVPLYHLDEGDMARAGGHAFRLDRFTLPLRAEGAPPMTVGYAKRTTRA